MIQAVEKFFSIRSMVPQEGLRGDVPESREMYRRLGKIAIPSVIEMVFMSIIGSVDMVMLRWLPDSKAAIAAVGLAGQPRLLTLALFFAFNVGVTAIVARRKGEGRREDANQALRNAIVLVLAFSLVVSAITLMLSRPFVLLAGAKEDTIEMCNGYFRIMTQFLPVSALTMCLNAAQRGVGNTKTTMYVNLTANLVNVFLDIFMIYGLRTGSGQVIIPAMGVEGDAWATGIGLCVGLVMSIIFITRGSGREETRFFKLSLRDDWRLRRETVAPILDVGGNALVEQVSMRIGFFAYAAIVARLGTDAVAAHQVGMQFLSLSFTFGDGLSVAATSLVGQMLGQKRPDLATIYGKCGQRIALCASLMIASVIMLLRAPLVGIFLDPSVPENAISFAMTMQVLLVVGMFQPLQMSNIVIVGCLRGAGDSFHVAKVMILCVVIIRSLLSLVAVYGLSLGLVGAWSSALVDMCVRLTLMYRRFQGGAWQLKRI